MEDMINHHSTKALKGTIEDGPHLTFFLRRKYALDDAITRIAMLPSKMLCNRLRINFLGESAIDLGGPTREFASLLHQQFANSRFVEGPATGKCFAHVHTHVQKGLLKEIGKLVAITLLQGGYGMPIFVPPVAEMIVFGTTKTTVQLEHIPNHEVRTSLEQVYLSLNTMRCCLSRLCHGVASVRLSVFLSKCSFFLNRKPIYIPLWDQGNKFVLCCLV